MSRIPVFDVITAYVLAMTNSGRITRRTTPEGTRTVHIDSDTHTVPAASYPCWALTILTNTGLTTWVDCAEGVEVALPTEAGIDALAEWECEFLGLTPPVSDRPLLCPPCLEDSFTPADEKELMRLIFEVTPEDLTGTD